ncbi:hypothetical protein [Nitrosovibrio sp. Nv17]|uniref:hypothetical protein n=1 Tax=Nitrosovibrio sp. Nv17 TaxID=1855339 RepID=UPI0009085120|nr:hypothetical protein [Nitrosovibrio sp. Nv17]SFW31963.1 hypothetical protein SAMN05216414_1165 [Nitrosovibrio sp. Nv17]
MVQKEEQPKLIDMLGLSGDPSSERLLDELLARLDEEESIPFPKKKGYACKLSLAAARYPGSIAIKPDPGKN